MDTIKEIFDLYEQYGSFDYIGEKVTQTEHMIQSAMVAEKEGADKETILAAFLHDIGHLLGHKYQHEQMDTWGTRNHDKIGGRYLRERGFPEKVCKLVENHVLAKRYLVPMNHAYYEILSEASKKTLDYQGGRMNEYELYEFETDPMRGIYFQFRKWEDMAKNKNMVLEPIEKYQKLMRDILG